MNRRLSKSCGGRLIGADRLQAACSTAVAEASSPDSSKENQAAEVCFMPVSIDVTCMICALVLL